MGAYAYRSRSHGEVDCTRSGQTLREEGQEERCGRCRGDLRGGLSTRREVRTGQDRGAAGHPGLACGAVAVGQEQTMLANAMRGLATEFGITVPKGMQKLDELMTLVDTDESIPKQAKQAITGLPEYCKDLNEGIETFEAAIVAHARHDETARRLATIPGIGPITASLIAATVVDISLFKTARQFAAWLGLVPRQHSTGGKTRLGRITKAGNREIRKLLVLGATSMVGRAEDWHSAVGGWLRNILERRPV